MSDRMGRRSPSGGVDLYLPHLKPKRGAGCPKDNQTMLQKKIEGILTSASIHSSENGSIGGKNSPREPQSSLFSPVLQNRDRNRKSSTAANTSMKRGSADITNQNLGFSFDNSRYKMSIQDMVNSAKKNSTEEFSNPAFGEAEIPRINPMDKPTVFKISKDPKPRDFLTMYQYQHRHDPGPKYNIDPGMGNKPHPIKPNCPRTLIKKTQIPAHLDAIIKLGKEIPGPGRYEPKKKPKVLGNYLQKVPTGQFVD